MKTTTNVYQLAGLDDAGRGFNRRVDMKAVNKTVQAVFRYERVLFETDPQATEHAAVATLIRQLQARGYTQLRSRLQFRGATYLGNQERWTDHPDPQPAGPLARLRHVFRRLFPGRSE